MSIPNELRSYSQWCVSDYTKGNNPQYYKDGKFYDLSIHDRKNFMTYDTAISIAEQFKINFGFILTDSDPFTCIDLDYVDEAKQKAKGQKIDSTKWTTSEQSSRFWAIINTLKSYTEQSCSLKGFHVWLKGDIGTGVRRDGVEVYSRDRYIACTGLSIGSGSIVEAQPFLDNMRKSMTPQFVRSIWDDSEELLTDAEIDDMAMAAENGEKYRLLANGQFHDVMFQKIDTRTGEIKFMYPSQSEADFALMSMFTFYSKNNEQCKRLFRYTALGQREKAVKDDRYLDETLVKLRSRELNDADRNKLEIELSRELVKTLNIETGPQRQFLHSPNDVVPPPKPLPHVAFSEIYAPDRTDTNASILWPPGMIGVVAKYIYDTAPRPVREVAIAAALGLFAGICGKCWSIPQSGLNLYIVLIARSGIGKEAIHSGISKLVMATKTRSPTIVDMIEQSEFGSGQALTKHLLKNPCFLNISGEWGRKLRLFSKEDGRNTALEGLRTKMTEYYQKSGPESIVGGLQYSKKDDSVASVDGGAYSFLGETTPDTFFESLSSSMMADGFLSRFTHIEYNGDRVPLNSNMLRQPEESIISVLADLANFAKDHKATVTVNRTGTVAQKLADYEKHCDAKINGTTDEAKRQMYNRAGLKALKIGALLAVADNHHTPIIQDVHIDWALHLVNKDIEISEKHLREGDIGVNDQSRQNKMLKVIEDYFRTSVESDTEVKRKMKQDSVITRKFIQTRVSSSPAFEKAVGGAVRALDLTLQNMIANGQILELDKVVLAKQYSFYGKAYRVIT
jgi:hypothetical protein